MLRSTFFGIALALGAFACSDDETTPPPPANQGGSGVGGAVQGGGSGQGGSGQGGASVTSGGGGNVCTSYGEGALPFTEGGETHCYWLVSAPAPQLAANDACGDDHHLATIASAAENAHVAAVATDAFPVWIGYRCEALPGTACIADPDNYAWMTGEPVTYVNWADGEPAVQRGAAMVEGGEWTGHDALNEPLSYVCESGPINP